MLGHCNAMRVKRRDLSLCSCSSKPTRTPAAGYAVVMPLHRLFRFEEAHLSFRNYERHSARAAVRCTWSELIQQWFDLDP